MAAASPGDGARRGGTGPGPPPRAESGGPGRAERGRRRGRDSPTGGDRDSGRHTDTRRATGKGSGASALGLLAKPLSACSASPSPFSAERLLPTSAPPLAFSPLSSASRFFHPSSAFPSPKLWQHVSASPPVAPSSFPPVERVPTPSHICLGLTRPSQKTRQLQLLQQHRKGTRLGKMKSSLTETYNAMARNSHVYTNTHRHTLAHISHNRNAQTQTLGKSGCSSDAYILPGICGKCTAYELFYFRKNSLSCCSKISRSVKKFMSFVQPVTLFLWQFLIHKRHILKFQWWVTKYPKNINWEKKLSIRKLKFFRCDFHMQDGPL